MNGYYYIINTLKDHIKLNGFTNTVTTGNIFDVDLNKQTIFPLVHIMTGQQVNIKIVNHGDIFKLKDAFKIAQNWMQINCR